MEAAVFANAFGMSSEMVVNCREWFGTIFPAFFTSGLGVLTTSSLSVLLKASLVGTSEVGVGADSVVLLFPTTTGRNKEEEGKRVTTWDSLSGTISLR